MDQVYDRISSIVEKSEGEVVLDLGVVGHDLDRRGDESYQWLHHHLTREFETVIGVDILEDEIERLRDEGYDVRYGNVESLDLDIEADTVVAGELIEHLADLDGFIRSVRRHLSPGGKFVLSTPNPWAFPWIRRLITKGQLDINEEHTHWQGPSTIEQLLERYGFVDIDIEITAPRSIGVSWVLYRLGFESLGGTHLVVSAMNGDDG